MGESIVGMEYTVVKSDTNTTAFTPGASYRATSIRRKNLYFNQLETGGCKVELRFYGASLKSEWSTSCKSFK